ncbi:hypothetical protein ACFFK0_28625 [Paenibacillus chartarius]|uniref:Uncharacterized protein n=1 Tax=Paenibacillus chartarius TaxID=747481 RepID=A0ABV6DUN0_9BACL
MTKQYGPDKNLQNVVDDLEKPKINAEFNQQQNQEKNDRRERSTMKKGGWI